LKVHLSALGITAENLQVGKLCISDVDVATEMTKNQPLTQAGTSMLPQANTIPQMALDLIR
jgi:flagellin